MSNLIKEAVEKFVSENNCVELREKLLELVTCDNVVDAIIVRQEKIMFNWKLKSELGAINEERANAGLRPLKPNSLEVDLIADTFQYLQQTNGNWRKVMRKSISQIMGIAKNSDGRYERSC